MNNPPRSDNFNATNPAAPEGSSNVVFQADGGPFSGTVNTSGTAVTKYSGDAFIDDGSCDGMPIFIGGVLYKIATVGSPSALTLTTSAGVQTGAAYFIPRNISAYVSGGKDTCGLGLVAEIEVPATSGDPDFQIAHGLGYQPSVGVIEITADGLIRWQSPTLKYDNTNVYLNASGSGLTATVKLLAPCNCTGGTPGITSLSPADANAGDTGFTLTVNGFNFRSDSIVNWNGSPRATTYVSQTQLTAALLTADLVSAGTAEITVDNPNAGCGLSGAVPFDIYNLVSGTAIGGSGGFVRDTDVPDGCRAGFFNPETLAGTSGPPAPYVLLPQNRAIQDISVTLSVLGSCPCDFTWVVGNALTDFNMTWPPLAGQGTPIGNPQNAVNTTGVLTGFGNFSVSAGQYIALRMMLTGCGTLGEGGTSLTISAISYRWK